MVLTSGVHGDNVQISMQRCKRQKQQLFDEGNDDDDDVNEENENQISVAQHYPLTGSVSIWGHIINKLKSMMKGQSAVLYLDFVRDVEEVVEILR